MHPTTDDHVRFTIKYPALLLKGVGMILEGR
jgi:hypothetical protein